MYSPYTMDYTSNNRPMDNLSKYIVNMKQEKNLLGSDYKINTINKGDEFFSKNSNTLNKMEKKQFTVGANGIAIDNSLSTAPDKILSITDKKFKTPDVIIRRNFGDLKLDLPNNKNNLNTDDIIYNWTRENEANHNHNDIDYEPIPPVTDDNRRWEQPIFTEIKNIP